MKPLLSLLAVLCIASAAHSQQTVFNVPSADVMDKKATYFEYDAVAGDTSLSLASTPRMVHGMGHGIETGINVTSFNVPTAQSVALVTTAKWKFYDNPAHGLSLFAGDHVYRPLTQRTYRIGNYTYLSFAKTHKNTRVAAGVYDFTAKVIDRANRAGIQASIEQAVTPKLSLATDWYSGHTGAGYVTPGFSYKLTPSVSVMAGMQMGNSGLLSGNHSVLVVVGWTPHFLQPAASPDMK